MYSTYEYIKCTVFSDFAFIMNFKDQKIILKCFAYSIHYRDPDTVVEEDNGGRKSHPTVPFSSPWNLGRFWIIGLIHPILQIVRRKTASAAWNRINSAPQTEATTFDFSSVFILLLWLYSKKGGSLLDRLTRKTFSGDYRFKCKLGWCVCGEMQRGVFKREGGKGGGWSNHHHEDLENMLVDIAWLGIAAMLSLCLAVWLRTTFIAIKIF